MRSGSVRVLVFLLALFLTSALGQKVVQGIVVIPPKTGCDYFIVGTPMGFALLQLWTVTIFKPEEDDIIVGDFESFGFKEVINLTQRRTYRVWVDDYWLSAQRVVEKYLRRCPYSR